MAALVEAASPWPLPFLRSFETARQARGIGPRAVRTLTDYALIWPLVGLYLAVTGTYRKGKEGLHKLTENWLPALGRVMDKTLATRAVKAVSKAIWHLSYAPFKYAFVNVAKRFPPWLAFTASLSSIPLSVAAWTYMPVWGFFTLKAAAAAFAQSSLTTAPGLIALGKGLGLSWAGIFIPKYAKAGAALLPVVCGPAASRFPGQVLYAATRAIMAVDRRTGIRFHKAMTAIQTRFAGEYRYIKYRKLIPFFERVEAKIRLVRRWERPDRDFPMARFMERPMTPLAPLVTGAPPRPAERPPETAALLRPRTFVAARIPFSGATSASAPTQPSFIDTRDGLERTPTAFRVQSGRFPKRAIDT